MSTEPDADDLDAQLAAAYADRDVAASMTIGARKKREQRHRYEATKENDGRSLRRTGRTSQLNIKIREDLKRRMLQAVRQDGRPIAVIAEELFGAFIAKTLSKGAKGADRA